MRTVKHGSRSFRSIAAKIWNSLPQHLRDISSFSVFKNQINAWGGGPVHVHFVSMVEMFLPVSLFSYKLLILIFFFSGENICCVYQKNRLNETVLLSSQNTC